MDINKQVLTDAINKWGQSSQVIMAIEELSELSQALCKSFRQDDINRASVLEEMADVYIMLEQIRMIFCNEEHNLQTEIDIKLRRLQKRLEHCA